jgi:hypothetical protein
MEKEFKKYSNDKGKILEEGLKKFGDEIGIDIYEDVNLNITIQIFITYFIYRCECKKFAEISQEEYTRGMNSFNATKVSDIKSR